MAGRPLILDSRVMDGDWLAASDAELVANATLVAPAGNAGAIEVRFDGGASVASFTDSISFRGVDLSLVELRGAAADTVEVFAQPSYDSRRGL